jgi:hypothetical protein
MRTKATLIALSITVTLSGCASYVPVEKDYTGPTATLADTGFSEDGSKAQMFAVIEVDGRRVMNAFWASANASQGRGNNLTTIYPSRKIKAGATKFLIKCSHATGAPIAAIASQMAGTYFSVEGAVELAPRADGRYAVKGELTKQKSSCWIEDLETGKPASAVISK